MIKFVFGKIIRIMENRLESERAAEKHTGCVLHGLANTEEEKGF